jgi:hypothetical protein
LFIATDKIERAMKGRSKVVAAILIMLPTSLGVGRYLSLYFVTAKCLWIGGRGDHGHLHQHLTPNSKKSTI